MKITSFDISKLDFHRGHPDDQLDPSKDNKEKDEDEYDEDEEEDEDEDEDEEDDDTKTPEGGLVMALANMQLQQRIKGLLP